MNLLGAVLYDPAAAVSKATSSLLAMTAFDTTNLRLTVTVPAHGMIRFKMRCQLTGATTAPTIFLGVLNSTTVVGRVVPLYENATANATTQNFALDAEFTATGLTPGSISFDAAYAVQVVVASTNIKYGGPNNNSGANAWGAFLFEAWDPRPMTLALDGAVNVKQWNGTNVSAPATAGIPDVNVKNMNNVSGASITTVKAVQGLTTADTIATYTGNTPQTGDAYARLGAPSGASVSADVAAVNAKTTNLPAAPASTTNITAGTITTTTNLTNLPAITAGWLTASGIAASALNGKGDWNIGKTGYALSAAGVQAVWDALTSALTTVGSIGKLLVDNVNATISSRLASASYTAQTGDAYARLGAPVGASISADIASVKTDTGTTIPGRLPAALVSGRMDASVGAMATGVLTATAIAADAITDAKVASDVTIASVTGSVGSIATGGITTSSFAAGAINAAAIATDAIGAAEIAADAITEIQSGLATSASISALNNVSTAQVQTAAAAALTAYDPPTRTEATADKDEVLLAVADVPTNAELTAALASADDATLAAITSATSPLATQASVNTIDDFLDTEIAAIKAKTDQLTFTVANKVDSNIKSVNDVTVTGTGETGDEWQPV